MKLRTAFIVLALALSGCNQQNTASQDGAGGAPTLDSPTSESTPSSVFEPVNEAARTATGQLTLAVSLHLPDAGQDGADAQEVLTLRGATGVVVEATITGAVSPATQVQGQTLRALFDIPVEEPQVLVYRVATETHPEGVQGLCGATQTAYVIVWEPSTPGEAAMKILGATGGAPGAAVSRACPMLEYRRG
jgi:hypothetical protein